MEVKGLWIAIFALAVAIVLHGLSGRFAVVHFAGGVGLKIDQLTGTVSICKVSGNANSVECQIEGPVP